MDLQRLITVSYSKLPKEFEDLLNKPLLNNLNRNWIPTTGEVNQAREQHNRQIVQSTSFDYSSTFNNRPFWIKDQLTHKKVFEETGGQCCFNHIIGLPRKTNRDRPFPLFDYEVDLFEKFEKYKRHCILKSRGLGLTEFCLRYIAWLCVRDTKFHGADIGVIVGPREKLAYKLIDRLKDLFGPQKRVRLEFNSAVTSLNLNGVNIEAFPSNNPNSFRGLEKPVLFLIDEADFFPHAEEEDTKSAVEGASAKSNPWIIFVSTPNKPRGFMEQLVEVCKEKGNPTSSEDNRYYLHLLDYTYGLNKIYSEREIQSAMQDYTFEREFNLKFLGQTGNVFSLDTLEAITTNVGYDPDNITTYGPRVIGIDPAFGGSSNFGITVLQHDGRRIQVLYADDFANQDFPIIMEKVLELYNNYFPVNKFIVDAANPEVIRRLKIEMGEDPNWREAKQRMLKDHIEPDRVWKVVPVAFGSVEGRTLLAHTKALVENKMIAIHPKFDKLITSMRTAVELNGILDKNSTSFNDIFDSFRLALYYFRQDRERKIEQ